MTLTRAHARLWLDRWDRQQEGYMPSREARFDLLIDAVAETAGRSDPLVLDLGCGPGSLGARLQERLPGAAVVGIDTDPLLMALGAAAYDGIRFVDADLRAEGWSTVAGLPPPRRRGRQHDRAPLAPGRVPDRALPGAGHGAAARRGVPQRRPPRLPRRHPPGRARSAPSPSVPPTGAFPRGVPRTGRPGGRPWKATPCSPPCTPTARSARAMAAHRGFESLHLETHVTALAKAGFTEIGTLVAGGRRPAALRVPAGVGVSSRTGWCGHGSRRGVVEGGMRWPAERR